MQAEQPAEQPADPPHEPPVDPDPHSSSPASSSPARSHSDSSGLGGPPPVTIVVADDASEVRLLVRTRLRLSGRFDVVGEAADGEEALQLAARHRPALLLLDVSMPRVDGMEALPRVLEVSPGTRVVVFSGFEEQGLVDKARQLGASAFVEKSAPMEELIQRLLQVAETGSSAEAGGHAEARGPAAAGGAVVPAYKQRGDLTVDQHVLDEHLERFREVFDQAAIGMATMTLAGNLVRVNAALGRLLGRDPTELVGTPYHALTDDAADEFASLLDEIRHKPVDALHLEHGVPESSSAQGSAASSGRVLAATFAPVRDSLGRPLYVFVQVQDVTAERAAVEELRQSEERFRLIIEAVEDYAIFMLDPQGHIVSWNAGAQRSKGYTADEIIGSHFRIFYPADVAASGHPEHELEVALVEGHYEEEGWRLRKDGSRFWANVLITAVRDSEGRHVGFAKVTRDTTARRQLEQERVQALERLAAANTELEMLNSRLQEAAEGQAQFLAVTAHELRSPVGVLGSSAEMLTRHWAELSDSERADLFAAMRNSTVRLRRLLEDLLTASRLQASALRMGTETVRLAEVVADAVATVARATPEVDIQVETGGDATVMGDRDRLAQAVENLVMNSVRHGQPPIRVTVVEHGGTAEIRVSDAGRGVSAAVLPRLFERFATGVSSGGTGLGLYIVRELARAHRGDARYDPAVGDQSGAFVITLPVATGTSGTTGASGTMGASDTSGSPANESPTSMEPAR